MNTDVLRSPKLKNGDLVRLVSPASYPDDSDVDAYVRTLESWGLRCDKGEHILSRHGYMAGSDSDRLKDLNSAYRDPQVRAIITTRGGAGAYRIADDIDFSSVRADPKPMIGFSDITSLHMSLYHSCRLGSIHGCIVGSEAQKSVKHLLMSTDPITLNRDPKSVSAAIEFVGKAQGPLIGGNLQMVATSIGVHMPSMNGAILFLEYHRAGLGTIDRYLTQLLRSDVLEKVSGVVLGSFESCRDHIERGWGVVNVLNDYFSKLNIPVLGGIRAGHDLKDINGEYDQYCFPLGSIASIDVGEGTFSIESIMC